MFNVRDRKTGRLFDSWGYLGPKRRKLLEESWAGLFRRDILPGLPVETLSSRFHDSFGRPTKEIYTTMGALIFQQMFDLTDNETVDQLAFNLKWHYALDLPEESDGAKYLCPRTLWTMRKAVSETKMDEVLFADVTGQLAKVFSVAPECQRLDSVHITSNMRRLGRIGIFVRVITRFLVNFRRGRVDLFSSLEPSFSERYLTKKGQGVFAMVKPSESAKTLELVGGDLFLLVRRFADNPAVVEMTSYKLMRRVLSEQCDVDSEAGTVSLKPPREISSDSLQNPSDPDAGYSAHKGQGYQAQIMETFSPAPPDDSEGTKVEGESKPGLRLITYVAVEPAHKSDAHALVPAIDDTKKRGLAPTEVLADSPYGSDDNVVAATVRGVAVISPLQGPKMDRAITLADFSLSSREEILRCPQGASPIKKAQRGKSGHVIFAADACIRCPLRPRCPVRPGKGGYWLRFNDKALRIARRRAHEKSPAFPARYRFRAGIEGTFSALDRRTGVKQLRVRGLEAVRYCVMLKALGLNILRAAVVRTRENGRNPALASKISRVVGEILTFVRHLFTRVMEMTDHLVWQSGGPAPMFLRAA